MNERTIAIGDIHGCTEALAQLVNTIELKRNDTLITLGDYVGKGDGSKGTLDFLIELQARCNLVPLLGNHDFLMRSVLRGDLSAGAWFSLGGQTVLGSYGTDSDTAAIPESHRHFLEHCRLFFESPTHFFVHACYDPSLPLAETDERTLLWKHLAEGIPSPHWSGKTAVVGHSSQDSGKTLDAAHLICIDTACVTGGRLTALDVLSADVWQVARGGTRLSHKDIFQ